MNRNNTAIIIPARLKSTRLPNKPLADIAGMPMIVRTALNCKAANVDFPIFVATDSQIILDVCKSEKIDCLLTSDENLTGTDRVTEAAKVLGLDFVINLQGDEPIFPKADILKFIDAVKLNPNKVHGAFCEITDKSQLEKRSIPKVVFDQQYNLLYASRAPIPFGNNTNFTKAHRQVCIYSFPVLELENFFSEKQKTPLEALEDIEFLRFIEKGIKVQLVQGILQF